MYIIISVSNFAYREIALNWATALKNLKIKNYRIYSLDEECHDYLLENNVNSVLWPVPQCSSFNKNLMKQRYYIMEKVLLEGEDLIYSDLDAVWLQDPISSLGDFDIHLSVVTHGRAYPRHIRKKWGYTLCTGWLAFKNTSLNFVQDFIKNYERHFRPRSRRKADDQVSFNNYVNSLNPQFYRDPPGHIFSFNVGKLKVLGLGENLILRGDNDGICKVCHPNIPKNYKSKVDELKRNNLWFLDK